MPVWANAFALSGANRRFLESLYSSEELGAGMVELLAASEEPDLHLAAGESLAPTRVIELRKSEARASAPEWIQLIPAGVGPERHVDTRDWRAGFLVKDPHAVVRRFNDQPEHLRRKVIDRNHIEHRNWDGRETPAAGWLLELAVRDSVEIWGRVEWTDEGREDVESMRYGYISPVVSLLYPTNSETGERDYSKVPELYEIKDASLVNSPALYIRWLLAPARDEDEQQHAVAAPRPRAATKDTKVMSQQHLEQFLQHFGLAPDASPEAFEQAARRLAAQQPTAPLVDLQAEVTDLKAKILRDEEAAKRTRVESLCTSAQKEGRLSPASREAWMSFGLLTGPDKLAEELAKLPVMPVTQRAPQFELPTTEQLGMLDAGDQAFAAQFGIDTKEFSQAAARQRGLRLGEQQRVMHRSALGGGI